MRRVAIRPQPEIPATDRIVTKSDNRPPPVALISTLGLEFDHQSLSDRIDTAEALLANLPARIDDDALNGVWQDKIPALTTLLKDIEAQRVATKAPYLTACGTIDGFFNESLAKRAKAVFKAIDEVCGAYLIRKRDAERARREAEAKRLRDEEAARIAEAARLRREADAQAAAERAKIEAETNEAKRKEAETLAAARKADAEQKAREAELAAGRAGEQADAAAAGVQAKSADMARTRSAGGSLGTLVDTWDFRIDDIDIVKGAPLWPYIDRAAKEKAIRAYLKANAPKGESADNPWQPLDGVTFFRKVGTQYRG